MKCGRVEIVQEDHVEMYFNVSQVRLWFDKQYDEWELQVFLHGSDETILRASLIDGEEYKAGDAMRQLTAYGYATFHVAELY